MSHFSRQNQLIRGFRGIVVVTVRVRHRGTPRCSPKRLRVRQNRYYSQLRQPVNPWLIPATEPKNCLFLKLIAALPNLIFKAYSSFESLVSAIAKPTAKQ